MTKRKAVETAAIGGLTAGIAYILIANLAAVDTWPGPWSVVGKVALLVLVTAPVVLQTVRVSRQEAGER